MNLIPTVTSDVAAKNGGNTYAADEVATEYTFTHESTGLPAGVKPEVIVVSSDNMLLTSAVMILAHQLGLIQYVENRIKSLRAKQLEETLLDDKMETDEALDQAANALLDGVKLGEKL